MIDMSTWKDLVVDIDDLHLDPRNVRLESPDGVTESDIAQDLFSNEDVLSLVEGIAKVGYLTHEVPIVTRRKRKLVVVEGNRRVTALKAIQNPYLVPNFQTQVTKLSSTVPNRDALRSIQVKVAPNDDAANQLIGAIHTGNQRRPWSPTRQAAFFQAQLEGGKRARDIIAQYPTVDVKKFILRSQFLSLFKSVDYSDLELKSFIENRKFPVSTLERLYPNSEFLEILGVSVDEKNFALTKALPPATFDTLAEKIIGDIKIKHIDTRKLNRTDSDFYRDYLNELRSLLSSLEGAASSGKSSSLKSEKSRNGDLSGGASPGGGDGASTPSASTSRDKGTVSGQAAAASPPSKKAVIPKKKSNYLDMADIVVAPAYPLAINLIVNELMKINVSLYPNATMDLLRTFLEKTIKAYAEQEQVDIRTKYHVNGYVYLSHCLQWVEDHLKAAGQRSASQVAAKIRGSRINGWIASMDHLNAVNHNHRIHASSAEVQDCWNIMHELMKVILKP